MSLLLLAVACCPLASPAQKEISTSTSLVTTRLIIPKGNTAFGTQFNNAATGKNNANAYLLCYLSTLIYPQYLGMVAGNTSDAYANALHSDKDKFTQEFIKYTSFLFPSASYSFIKETNLIGYDPEAMVISTPTTIYVVFRGTDRVSGHKANTFMYDWSEWIMSDFDTRHLITPELTGKVHAGFWFSLANNDFKGKLLNEIKSKGGETKKVWITGHSLGAAHAQLFAMFMAKKGITAQGVYAYAAPHPGTQEYVDEMNRLFPNNRLQRFDFVNDPVTMLSFYSFGFRRAGTRVYYNDINTMQFGAQERNPLETLSLFPALSGVITNGAADYISSTTNNRIKFDAINLSGSPFCYHHPLWYLRAAYNQLNATEKSKVPSPLSLPDNEAEACDILTVTRGKSANPLNMGRAIVGEVAAAINQGLEQLSFAANAIIDNVIGSAITEGEYYIKLYPSEGKLGLNEMDGMTNGSSMSLTTAKSKVKIKRFGAIGYIISFGTKTVSGFFGDETKEYVLDSDAGDLLDDGSTTIQLWEKNNAPGFSANQRWLFIKVKDNKYVIKNLANGKLLDSGNGCVSNNSCSVKTWNPINNDQTQIWVVEKAN
jgi:hypothetical protein